MEQVEVLGVAKGISDYGMMIMICAFFFVMTGTMWLFVFKWFKHLLDNVVTGHEKTINNLLDETRAQNGVLSDIKKFNHLLENVIARYEKVSNDLLVETRAQNEVLSDISAGLQPISQMQINSVCNNFFELDCERLCRLVKNIRRENNIDNKEKTRKKIETRVGALLKKRSVEFGNFVCRGKRLSEYMRDEWSQKLADIVEGEIYNENGANNERAYANIKTCVDEMKVEFFNRING